MSTNPSALELIPAELQDVALGTTGIARAVALAGPTNRKVREAADDRLRFEDEPATHIGFLVAEAEGR